MRRAALESGLQPDVADVLALAARGISASFQITYSGDDGAELQVSQDPPNRRVDVLKAGLIVQSQVERGEVGYLCELPPSGRPGDNLDCKRREGAISTEGAFSEDALQSFAAQLARSLESSDLTVETREIAATDATCLISQPKPGTVIDQNAPGVDTLCLAPDGAQLLVDTEGQRVVASSYTSKVPAGTFDV